MNTGLPAAGARRFGRRRGSVETIGWAPPESRLYFQARQKESLA